MANNQATQSGHDQNSHLRSLRYLLLSFFARITKDVSRNLASAPTETLCARLQFFEPMRYKLTRARVEEVVIQNSGFNASSHSGLSYLRMTATSSPAHPSAPHPAASSVPKSIAACGLT